MFRPPLGLPESTMIQRACALAALLALFLQGSGGGHMLLVEHTRCAEHGELVHEGGAHHHGAPERAETNSVAFRSSPADGSEEAHEHCALAADRRDALVAIVEAQVSAYLIEARQSVTPAYAFVPADAERFRIAPKSSPPA